MTRIILVDTSRYYPSSPLFAEALQELATKHSWGCEFVDEAKPLRFGGALRGAPASLLAGSKLWQRALNKNLLRVALHLRPHVVLVVKGAPIVPQTLERLKRETDALLINYATDDPFNVRVSSQNLVECIPLYDIYVCTKRKIMDDVRQAGCGNVAYLPFGYKPTVHFPEMPSTAWERRRFHSDVVFLGGADEDRVPYFEHLVAKLPGIRLRLFGGYWSRHRSLRRYHEGFARGRNYRLAIGGARIVVNLVRRANRDGHVMRSFEIPACGGFMLAEKTDEHAELFAEDREAGFFSTPVELALQVKRYLAEDALRTQIAKAGFAKVRGGSHRYIDRLSSILSLADEVGRSRGGKPLRL